MEATSDVVIVPAPALSEVLVHADDAASRYLDILSNTARFRIAPFDERAAIELAVMTRDALGAGDLRAGTKATRAKLKFDRQIIAIARTEGCKTIYSDDEDIARLADTMALTVIPIYKLPRPAQSELDLDSAR